MSSKPQFTLQDLAKFSISQDASDSDLEDLLGNLMRDYTETTRRQKALKKSIDKVLKERTERARRKEDDLRKALAAAEVERARFEHSDKFMEQMIKGVDNMDSDNEADSDIEEGAEKEGIEDAEDYKTAEEIESKSVVASEGSFHPQSNTGSSQKEYSEDEGEHGLIEEEEKAPTSSDQKKEPPLHVGGDSTTIPRPAESKEYASQLLAEMNQIEKEQIEEWNRGARERSHQREMERIELAKKRIEAEDGALSHAGATASEEYATRLGAMIDRIKKEEQEGWNRDAMERRQQRKMEHTELAKKRLEMEASGIEEIAPEEYVLRLNTMIAQIEREQQEKWNQEVQERRQQRERERTEEAKKRLGWALP